MTIVNSDPTELEKRQSHKWMQLAYSEIVLKISMTE